MSDRSSFWSASSVPSEAMPKLSSTKWRMALWLRSELETYPRAVTYGEMTIIGTRNPHSFGSDGLP